MLDSNGKILYVGKALNLKKRVSQYFQKTITCPKTQALVQQIATVEVMITASETEALLLESHLIKTNHPKYNILLRDDKTYPYIIITTKQPYPSIQIKRSKQKPKNVAAFGPYPNASAVHEVLNLIHKCFKLRNCRDSIFATRIRPCLQYQIKRCSAPCTSYISQAEYLESVELAKAFLLGKSEKLLTELNNSMQNAVHQLKFELAASLRDQIQQIRHIQASQGIIQDEEDLDIVAISLNSPIPCIEHVTIRKGSILNTQAYFPAIFLSSMDNNEQYQHIFEAFLSFYYFEHPERIPKQILTPFAFDKNKLASYQEALKQYRKHSCKILTKAPKNAKAWLLFALNNLQIHQKQQISKQNFIQERMKSLAEILHLKKPINQLACFDISHTHGHATVASCVVFNKEGPLKTQYRKYNIVNTKPSDDYGALSEAILRHFKHLTKTNAPYPEVLLIDGGKGQVNVAAKVLKNLNITDIKLLGITKGEGRKAEFDRIYVKDTKTFLPLKSNANELFFFQHLRDEAHRFAISSHRKKRNKAQLSSSLESIPGIGPKKRKALIQYFAGLQGVKKASIEELCKVKGINKNLAKLIVESFT